MLHKAHPVATVVVFFREDVNLKLQYDVEVITVQIRSRFILVPCLLNYRKSTRPPLKMSRADFVHTHETRLSDLHVYQNLALVMHKITTILSGASHDNIVVI